MTEWWSLRVLGCWLLVVSKKKASNQQLETNNYTKAADFHVVSLVFWIASVPSACLLPIDLELYYGPTFEKASNGSWWAQPALLTTNH